MSRTKPFKALRVVLDILILIGMFASVSSGEYLKVTSICLILIFAQLEERYFRVGEEDGQ